jgi:signal transduction histidine kinase
LANNTNRAAQKQALTASERVRRYGLLGALHLLARDFSSDEIEIEVDTQGYLSMPIASEALRRSGLDIVPGETVYRITQESLSNAIKHAQARHILIKIECDKFKKLCLSIKDDGVGFIPKPGEESQAGGFGMNTMRERTEALGGSLRVISAPGEGTTVEVVIPIGEGEI